MIVRYTFIKLKDDAVSDRDRLAAQCRDAALGVPQVVRATVGVPADAASARSWDLALAVTVGDAAAARSWQDDLAWSGFFERVLAPRMSFIKAWDFTPLE